MRNVGITPLTSFSSSLQASNKDGRASNVLIPGASLTSGHEYLVLYSASYGAKGKNHRIGARLEHGNTILGKAFDKGIKAKNKNPREISHLSGYCVITGDGSSDLTIRFSRSKGSSYIFNASLVAIPLDSLISDADYFVSQQHGDAAEVTTTSSYQTLIESTFKLPEKGKYLVLMSAEGFISKGKKSEGEGFRYFVDGVQQKPDAGKQWKLNNASRCSSYARTHSLPAGLRKFRIDVGALQGSRAKSFRRGRIIVLRVNALDQTLTEMGSQRVSSTNTFSPYLAGNYSPNRQEYVLALCNSWANHSILDSPVTQRIRNTTDASDWTSSSESTINQVVDKSLLTSFACEQISDSKNYELQVYADSGNPSWEHGDLILLSLTGTPIDTVIMPDSDGSSQGSWAIVGGASTHADTLDTADSDSTYVWLDGATTGDFLDVKLDKVSGAVDTQISDEVILEFRARSLSDQKECDLSVSLYEGDPSSGGTIIDGHTHTLSETEFEEIRQTFDWVALRGVITDFNNLYIRILVEDVTGAGGAPDPAISLVRLSLPGKTSKNLVMNSAVEATDGETYAVYDQTGKRYRKVKYLAEQEGWTDRNGVPLETPDISIIAYEVEES